MYVGVSCLKARWNGIKRRKVYLWKKVMLALLRTARRKRIEAKKHASEKMTGEFQLENLRRVSKSRIFLG